MSQLVFPMGENAFEVFWTEQPEQRLQLNFAPIIEHFQLSGTFVLIHWQAKPYGLRRWGLFDSATQSYKPFDYNQLIKGVYLSRMLQIPEKQYTSIPSAVILVEGRVKPLSGQTFTISTTL